MKIKHIEAIPLVRELEQEFVGGTYRITSRYTIVTRVELDNGIVGETFGGDETMYQMDICTSHQRGLQSAAWSVAT